MIFLFKSLGLLCGLLLTALSVAGQEQQFAELGDFKLENGQVIRDCLIGYRTFGKLNEAKSNAVIFPTWASGTSEYLKGSIGPGKLVDSDRYFVIAIDALGNGVSSSPSNSKLQPRMSFPNFTLRDTVNTQHEVVTRILKLNHVKAVIGISMGGMQAFQWIVSYPEFMNLGVPIVGSPRLAPYDLLLWQSQLDGIMNDPHWNNGEYTVNPARIPEYEFGALLLTTPENFNKQMTRERVLAELKKAREARGGGFDANDKVRQVQAIMAMDVSAPYGGSLKQAAARVKAKVFIVVAKLDHVVTPGPALEFAELLRSKLMVLEGDCGHLATSCEANKLNASVDEFLRQ